MSSNLPANESAFSCSAADQALSVVTLVFSLLVCGAVDILRPQAAAEEQQASNAPTGKASKPQARQRGDTPTGRLLDKLER